MKPLFATLVVALASVNLHAQKAPPASGAGASEEVRLIAIGASIAQAVYVTHMAMNNLSDAWVHKAYTDDIALTLAASYEGGLRSMLESLDDLIAKGGLSPADLTSVNNYTEAGRLVEAQIQAFKEVVKQGGEESAKGFEARRLEAQTRIFALMGIEGGGETATAAVAPNRLEFEILEARMPLGGPGQLGKVVFERGTPANPYAVTWQYTDGTSDKGIAVAFPGSPAIAVGFGPEVLGVAIYELNGKEVKAHWAPYAEDAEIGTYTMQQGANDSIYHIDGQEKGTLEMEETGSGTARLTWKYPSGTLHGYGVAVGKYLAAVSVKPGEKSGVAIYLADPEKGTATGKWTMENVLGKVGEENYRFLKAE